MQKQTIANRYHLKEHLSQVSEANYFQAVDIVSTQPVTLRTLDISQKGAVGLGLERLADQKLKKMMENEQRLLPNLHHPHLLDILDHGFDDPLFFQVFPPFHFESLQSRLNSIQVFPLSTGLAYMSQTAQALAHLHHHGIVHCDVSAENLLLIEDQIKVIEFSIANFEAMEGVISGNPPYMSPEAIQGAQPAPTRDIWALGVTMVYILTGTLPFGDLGEPRAQAVPKLFRRILQEPPTVLALEKPPKLTALILQMLEKNPAVRISDLHRVTEELEVIKRTL